MLNEWSDRDPEPPRPTSGPRRFLLGGILTLVMLGLAINILSVVLARL